MVTDIKALMYEPNKTISYKLHFTEQNRSDLPLLRNSKQEKITFDMLPQLHMNVSENLKSEFKPLVFIHVIVKLLLKNYPENVTKKLLIMLLLNI